MQYGVIGYLIISIVVVVVCQVVGLCLVKTNLKESNREVLLLTPVVGYCAISFILFGISVFIGKIPDFLSVLIVATLVTIAVYSIKRDDIDLICEIFKHIVLSALVVSLCVYGIMIHNNGVEFSVSIPLFDHAKVALVNSINRSGLPIINPFSYSSVDPTLHYYFAWYFSAAVIANLLNIDGYGAIVVNSWVTGIFLFLLLFHLSFKFHDSSKRPNVILWSVLLGAGLYIPGFVYPRFFIEHHSLETLVYQLPWVPQHVFTAVGVCVVFTLIMSIFNENKIKLSDIFVFAITAVIISWSFGASVYVGGIFFSICSVLLFFIQIRSLSFSNVIIRWIVLAVLSLIFSSYFILNYIGVVGTEESSFPLAFRVWEVVRGKTTILDFLLYLTVAPFIYFGVLFLCFIVYFSNKVNISRNKEWFVIAIVSFVLPFFVQSVIANNDFGWRVILPFVIISSALVPVILNKMDNTAKLICIILGAQYAQGVNWHTHLLGLSGPLYFNEYMLRLNDVIVDNTECNSRLLFNSDNVTGRNLLIPVLIDRNLSYFNESYALSLGEGTPLGKENISNIQGLLNRLYADGNLKTDDIDILKKLAVDYIILLKEDKIFNNGLDDSWFELSYSDNLCKIYKIK